MLQFSVLPISLSHHSPQTEHCYLTQGSILAASGPRKGSGIRPRVKKGL